jgi:GDPmannose 4,6-dehydratase
VKIIHFVKIYGNIRGLGMSSKVALITGITGQDGAMLAELLLGKGYQVHGVRPYSAVPDTANIDHLDNLKLHYGDLTDGGSLIRLLEKIKPDEIYNMAGLSHVHASFDLPEVTANINALGPLRLLEAMRALQSHSDMRIYQASSSEMFGEAPAPQNENTNFAPCSPYGAAKLYAYWMMRNYRDAYGIYAANGILFNHESAIRGEGFVTRKITKTVCEIEAGVKDKIMLGNLDSQRDWGHAKDYMDGVWRILQHDKPDDFVLASGQSRSVREFVGCAFSSVGHALVWEGEGVKEKGRDKITGNILVEVDPRLFRPTEIHHLLGDASKAKSELNWQPQITFEEMIEEMIQADRIVNKTSKFYAA